MVDATRHLGITTRPDLLASQLDYFARRYVSVGLEEVISGRLPERAILITIDDAYRSVLEVAAPMLKARGLKAVLFANPAPIARPFMPLDNVLSIARSRLATARYREMLVQAGLEGLAFHKAAAGSAYGMPPALMGHVKQRMLEALGIAEAALHRDLGMFLRPADLVALADYDIEIANHTMSHTCCHLLQPNDLVSEIADARAELEAMSRRPVRAFAFPWGHERDATPEALAVIRASGHRATFLMHGRRNDRRPGSDIWYRSLIENQTGLGLAADLAVKPLLRSLKLAAGRALGR